MKITLHIISILSTLFIFTGCAAALVPKTSSPEKKISNAYFLIDSGRSLPARNLIFEALESYKANNDEVNMARAYTALGDLYRNGKTQGEFKLPDLKMAMENYNKAASFYKKNNMPKWSALNEWAAGISYAMNGDSKSGCTSLKQATKSYNSSPSPHEKTEPFEKAGSFNLKTIENELQLMGCK